MQNNTSSAPLRRRWLVKKVLQHFQDEIVEMHMLLGVQAFYGFRQYLPYKLHTDNEDDTGETNKVVHKIHEEIENLLKESMSMIRPICEISCN